MKIGRAYCPAFAKGEEKPSGGGAAFLGGIL
jgi:hypothetical protein